MRVDFDEEGGVVVGCAGGYGAVRGGVGGWVDEDVVEQAARGIEKGAIESGCGRGGAGQ